MLTAGVALSAVVKGETANNAWINKIDHQYQRNIGQKMPIYSMGEEVDSTYQLRMNHNHHRHRLQQTTQEVVLARATTCRRCLSTTFYCQRKCISATEN